MAGENDNPTGDDPAGGPATPPASTPPATPPSNTITLTQDELNRRATQEKQEGKRAAERQIAETLGVSIEEAKAIVKAQQDKEAESMSEAERKAADADKKLTAAEQKDRSATLKLRQADVKLALAGEGITEKAELDLVSNMILPTLADDADEAAVQTAVAQLKETMPRLFSPEGKKDDANGDPPPANPGLPPAPGSVPPAPPSGGNGNHDDAYSKGVELAKELAKKQAPTMPPGWETVAANQ